MLIITDRTELDEQIEKVFKGVNEDIYRTKSGADLIATLNATTPWLVCSLIHKFGGKEDGEEVGDIPGYIEEVKKALPPGFAAKGDLFVFVDECHRTQSGELHEAMKAILPDAVFIGFTGTPLLKADKQKSIEVFGRYIHTYKFDEAVKDRVVLDLRYEARDIDQSITSQAKIDQWFEAKTKGLTDLAKAQLKQRWGTMQKVLSSQSRLEKIVADILMDMETRDRLKSGRGNAMLVSGSIYQACKFYELFAKTDLEGKCAIVTSYGPSPADIKGEESGEGVTEKLRQYDIYQKMLADWFNEPPETAVNQVEEFEKAGEEEVHRGAGADEAPDRGGQAADRLRRAAGHLSLHRQADAGPRPVPGHLPREPAGRRRQGIRLHHRLQGPVQEPGGRGPGLHLGRARRLRQGGRGRAAGGPAGQGAGAAGRGARGRQGAVRAGRSRRGTRRPTCATSAPRSPATPSSSRTTSRSGWRSTSTWRPWSGPTPNLANELAEAGYTAGRDRRRSRPRSTTTRRSAAR